MNGQDVTKIPVTTSALRLSLLQPRDVLLIEEALKKVAPFGEVHLVVERGRLRFVRTIKSEAIDSPSP